MQHKDNGNPIDRLLEDILLFDADKSFTDYDYTMTNDMFEDSRSITRFFLTFNDSADGNNPQELKVKQ